ncbi:MAG: non-ribosomal peptide synthetase [Clostridia bacterium]|nr:non-ribosomal peptide synthetase [Clostridia bacterium]
MEFKLFEKSDELTKITEKFNISLNSLLLSCYIVMLRKMNPDKEQNILAVSNKSEAFFKPLFIGNESFFNFATDVEISLRISRREDIAKYDAAFISGAPLQQAKKILKQSNDKQWCFVCQPDADGVKYCIAANHNDKDMDNLMQLRFEKILCEVIDNTAIQINELSIISEYEKNLIRGFGLGETYDIPKTTFHGLFEQQVSLHPDKTAVTCGDCRISYDELNKRANQVANYIRNKVSDTENLIGVFMERSVDFIVAILGIMKSGNGYVPIDSDTLNPGHDSFPKKRLEFMLQDTKMPFIITKKQFTCGLADLGVELLCIDSGGLDQYLTENLNLDITERNIAYGIYTSGSTGFPKLTVVEHHNVLNLLSGINRCMYSKLSGQEPERVSQNAPFGFDASVQQFIALIKGYCLCIIPENVRKSVNRIIEYINQNNINVFDCTPSQLELLVNDGMLEKCSEHLKLILVGGEAIPDKLWNRLKSEEKIKAYNVYGPTECTVDSTFLCINQSKYDYAVIGRPMDNYRVFILDENRNNVPIGCAGEIYIAGNGVSRGYHNREEQNKASFLILQDQADGLINVYKTGDRGLFLPDGSIYYLGRNDGQIKIRSHRIEVAEIMTILNKHKHIKSSLVVVNDDAGYKKLIAYFIMDDNKLFDANEISEFLSEYLPKYMIPNHYVLIDQWPLTPNKKIDKSKLPLPEELLKAEKSGSDESKDELEKEIAGIMCRILSVDNIGLNDSFMRLGGDSLRVMTFLAEIFGKYDVEIDFAEFFKTPTITFIKGKLQGKSQGKAKAEKRYL